MIVGASIRDQIYEELHDEILKGLYKSGDQLNPKILAQHYGVSPMPVRDALLHLVQKKLVVNKERVGFFVASYTNKNLTDLMEVRKLYEVYIIEQYINELDKNALLENYKKMSERVDDSQDEFDRLDTQFHKLIVSASGNDVLVEQYSDVEGIIELIVYKDKTHRKEALLEHNAILNAIVIGDKRKAVEALLNHLDRSEKQITQGESES